MKRRGLALGRRFAAAAAAAVLALSLAGDRGRAATVPAAVYGQDPLEVLELKVRPNVIVVLDSSGSMTNVADESFNTNSGDHPRSKLWQAKQVLKTLVQNNQDKVSFQFGTYTQQSITFANQGASTTGNRFQYVTSTAAAASLSVLGGAAGETVSITSLTSAGTSPRTATATTSAAHGLTTGQTVSIVGASPNGYNGTFTVTVTSATSFTYTVANGLATPATGAPTFGRGLQSWQIIRSEWNRLYFGEAGGVVCYATVPVTPRFYNSGAALAADLQAAMNAATCTSGSRANTYTVTYAKGTGVFSFARATGASTFQIRWADAPNSIRGALGRRTTGNTALNTTAVTSGSPYRLLFRNTTGNSGGGMSTSFSFTEVISTVSTTFYQLAAGRVWNGEVVRIQSDGTVCGMTFPTAAEMTNPPTVTLQLVADTCGADTAGSTATFTFAGGDFENNSTSCQGFRSKSSLIPCDLQSPPAPTQVTQVGPYIDGELPFQADGRPADLTTNGAAYGSANYGVPDGIPDYVETQDGSWATQSIDIAPSAKADGYTPIAHSLIDIKGLADASDACLTNSAPPAGKLDSVARGGTVGVCVRRGFSELWQNGQAGSTAMAGPAPWQLDGIQYHKDPKEKTIVLFVTDGDDTCGTRGGGGSTSNLDTKARRAASYAEVLYTPIVATEPASSVQTYVIGYGGAFTSGEPYRLNWIAWGGSGLGQGTPTQPDVTWASDSAATLKSQRAKCTTCTDAFVAPDASTLATQLQSLIDQGASDGDFNAQQSITESVFEYVDRATTATRTYGALSPSSRYQAITPTRFVSSFSLPGFKGQLKAYQNDGSGNAVLRWSAGDKLWTKVSTEMSTCNNTTAGGLAGECVFSQLHGGTTDATIAGSAAKIQRRIYTTDRNGVFTFTPQSLMAGTANSRRTLWPPEAAVTPNDYATPGLFDRELGLPLDAPTCTLVAPYTSCVNQELARLQKQFQACVGPSLPPACTTGSDLNKMKAARREARDIMLAFMAGAATIPDTTGIKRTTAVVGSSPARSLLFKARSWVLADSELATAAVVTQPNLNSPTGTPYPREYELFRDGPRDASTDKNPDTAGNQIRQGFGLTRPDDDRTVGTDVDDTRLNLKPVMTVIYAPANDMLHAFRAGPCFSPSSSGSPANCAGASYPESGGEELWGFVPYDQLVVVGLRPAHEPQGRSNHVFMLARGIRFADVFVPGAMTNVSIGGVTEPTMQGVWRRVLYFGRGIGGKHVTALDVTAPGPYTATALSTVGPIPLWNRGNPDSQDGLASGLDNGLPGTTDRTAYARMGETWSMPTVAYVNADKKNPTYRTVRRPDPDGIDFAIFMGSGYGATGEGTTHYTLDALSGDVIAAVDVEDKAADYGLTRTTCTTDLVTGKPIETATCSVMPNALVANSVSFNRSAFAGAAAKVFNMNPHPWSKASTRVYIGDLHGRIWKFLTASPDVAIPAADLGATQPIGTAVALMAEGADAATNVPIILVSAGADKRASGPFRSFSLRDNGPDTFTIPPTTGTVTDDGVTTFTPVEKLFARTFDQGDPEANCGYTTEALFRGTIQPTGAVECSAPLDANGKCPGDILERAFFGGTRLSLPNTRFAPPTPLSCGTGEYPCRSQFDSVLYALGALTGQAAYDLNSSGDDAYRIFRDSRLVAISMQADPNPGRGGSSFVADEGLVKGTPKAPPPPGVPPSTPSATANVVFKREPGQPAPAVRYGSTVCQ